VFSTPPVGDACLRKIVGRIADSIAIVSVIILLDARSQEIGGVGSFCRF
jgi:hypothetical protein